MNKLVESIARVLEPEERTVVLGDLMETNATGATALRSIAGLVLRRQAALWMNWRPWLALIGLVGVVCPVLWVISSEVTAPVSMDIQTYWRVGSLYSSGLTIREEFYMSLIRAAGLFVWSWTSGFVLSRLAGKTIWTVGMLYFLRWTFPLPLTLVFALTSPRVRSGDVPLLLVLVALQASGYVCLFVYPSIKGMRHSLKGKQFTGVNALCLTAIVFCLIGLATWMGGWQGAAVTRWSGSAWDASPGWPLRLVFYSVLAWPAIYLLFTAKRSERIPPFAKL